MVTVSVSQVEELLQLVVQLAMLSGFIGAGLWHLMHAAFDCLLEWLRRRDERAQRVAEARMRHVHGPAMYPGLSAPMRRAKVAFLQRHGVAHG